VDEAHVVSCRTFAHAAGVKRTPFALIQDTAADNHRPQADVIERRRMHRRLLVGIERLHEIDFNGVGAAPSVQMSSSTFSRSETNCRRR